MRNERLDSFSDNVREYSRWMLARVHLVVHARDPALLVDEKAHALRPLRFRIIAGAVSQREATINVAKQWEREVILLRKRGVRLDAVEAGAENLNFIFVVVVLMVAEPATFCRSARGVSRRIEPQQHFASAQSGKRNRLAIMRRQRKFGSLISCFDHLFRSFLLAQFSIARSRARACTLA
jgi:hypothetical protein